MGKQQQILPHPGDALAAPEVETGEGKGAAPVGGPVQKGIDLRFPVDGQSLKVDHFSASRISPASSRTKWGLTSEASKISRVVSPLSTSMVVMPAFRPERISV